MELTTADRNPSYYAQVRHHKNLVYAWRKVYESGIKSKSLETKKEICAFNENLDNKIDKIYRRLLKKKYNFTPAKGIPVKRKHKTDRPIVKSIIPDRIVQRSILDVLQSHTQIRDYISLKTSFGGIEERGVRDAIKMAYEAIQNGAKCYISSDIKNFFSDIPKDKVLEIISGYIPDTDFNNLLQSAVKVELENLSELGEKKELFPIYEIGVAQGCCLSPFVGNMLLHDFDLKFNDRGIICLRYIDDFLILGPTPRHVKAAFKSAKKMLNDLGLSVYDPFEDEQKAHFGSTEKKIEFLGCDILPGLIRPSKKGCDSFLERVEKMLTESSRLMSGSLKIFVKGKSFIETLTDVSNIIMGWGSQYSFCNDFSLMSELDRQINLMLKTYLQEYERAKCTCKEDSVTVRRLLGVRLLAGDCKSDPIIC